MQVPASDLERVLKPKLILVGTVRLFSLILYEFLPYIRPHRGASRNKNLSVNCLGSAAGELDFLKHIKLSKHRPVIYLDTGLKKGRSTLEKKATNNSDSLYLSLN